MPVMMVMHIHELINMYVMCCAVSSSQQCVPCRSEGRLVWSVGNTRWTCRLWSRARRRQVSTVTR